MTKLSRRSLYLAQIATPVLYLVCCKKLITTIDKANLPWRGNFALASVYEYASDETSSYSSHLRMSSSYLSSALCLFRNVMNRIRIFEP